MNIGLTKPNSKMYLFYSSGLRISSQTLRLHSQIFLALLWK